MGVFQSCCNNWNGDETAVTKEVPIEDGEVTGVLVISQGSAFEGEDTDQSTRASKGFFVDDAGALCEEYGGVNPDSEEKSSSTESLRSKRKLCRNQTFYFVNSGPEKEEEEEIFLPRESMKMVKKVSSRVSRISTGGKTEEQESIVETEDQVEIAKTETLENVAKLVDQAYDILPAEMILAQLEIMIGKERFMRDVVTSDLFERFGRKLDFFYDVGLTCSEPQTGWMDVYNGANGTQLITGQIDSEDPSVLHYSVRVDIPASITHVLAVANELELMPKWNTLMVGQPQVQGRRTAHYMVLNYQMSAVGGMYKVDVLNEIRRFSDQSGGFMVEYITSVAPDHPSYKEPLKGYKRMQTLLKNVFIACGPEYTILIQRGRLKLGFSVSPWIAKTIGGAAGKFIVGGLVNNSLRACEPNNAWEKLIENDKYGLYQRLNELRDSEESCKRDPKNSEDGKVVPYDIETFFNKRRFHRASSRHVKPNYRPSHAGSRTTTNNSSKQEEVDIPPIKAEKQKPKRAVTFAD